MRFFFVVSRERTWTIELKKAHGSIPALCTKDPSEILGIVVEDKLFGLTEDGVGVIEEMIAFAELVETSLL